MVAWLVAIGIETHSVAVVLCTTKQTNTRSILNPLVFDFRNVIYLYVTIATPVVADYLPKGEVTCCYDYYHYVFSHTVRQVPLDVVGAALYTAHILASKTVYTHCAYTCTPDHRQYILHCPPNSQIFVCPVLHPE